MSHIAFLLHNHFEQSEYDEVKNKLEQKGHQTTLITTNDSKQVQAMQGDVDKSETFTADLFAKDADIVSYDALVLPGGTVNSDTLRHNDVAKQLIKDFYATNKPLAAICHAAWALIDTGIAKGKTLTAYQSVKTDLVNAGATFVDESVQVDGQIITSRNPNDIDDFVDAIDKALTA